jgi:hypothetical protein
MLSLGVKWALFSFGFYHVVAGAFVLGPSRWVKTFGKNVYSLDVPEGADARYFITLKFLGLMALMLASLSFILVQADPFSQSLALVFYALLFLLRGFCRYYYQEEFKSAFQIEFKRSFKNIIFNTLLAMATLALAFFSFGQIS